MKKIAIVGRPNVGKSALFNRLVRKRLSIVHEEEGVTRDRLYGQADYCNTPFELIDTGGIDPRGKGDINAHIREQAAIAIQEADLLIQVVDGLVGPTQLDQELSRLLLQTDKPLALAVNKLDTWGIEARLHDFYSLGIEKMTPVSAVHGRGVYDLLESILEGVDLSSDDVAPDATACALVGRPNVGKSTLLNTLLDEERSIVSPIAGTTRDSLDALVEMDGHMLHLIDTAGIRKKRATPGGVDKFAAIRTKAAIERSSICLFMLDVREGLSQHDKRIARWIEDSGKGCVILLNKWDLVKGFRLEHATKALALENRFLSHCPTLPLSAKTGHHLDKLLGHILSVKEAYEKRIPTSPLNKFVEEAMRINHPPMIKGKRLRVYYLTQTETHPPHFTLFVNRPDHLSESYKRYLIHAFRKQFHFPGVPLKFSVRKRGAHKS